MKLIKLKNEGFVMNKKIVILSQAALKTNGDGGKKFEGINYRPYGELCEIL